MTEMRSAFAHTRHAPSFIGRGSLASLLLAVCTGLCGCASTNREGGILDKAMQLVGLSNPPQNMGPDMPALAAQKSAQVTLRIHAGDILNTDSKGQSLSLVARIYKLRAHAAFVQAPYDAFKEEGRGSSTLGNDVVEMREIVLTPGQKYEMVETMAPEATHIAVVGLLRAPDPRRWKFVFDARDAARTGITIGAHGCALSVAVGEPLMAAPESRRLAGVSCG